MGKFKQIAVENVSLCKLMVGREKIETGDIIGEQLTIIAFDFAPKFDDAGSPIVNPETGEADVYSVVTFQEAPGKYYCGGSILTKICQAWAAGYDSPEKASEDLEKEGGVKVSFRSTRTRGGKSLTSVDIIG